jgi:glycosyltransferase involved in cell wall biosynthesis
MAGPIQRMLSNAGAAMKRVLIATDAWDPQVNGLVRTLQSLAAAAMSQGTEITFLTPDGFRSFALPTYPGLRCAVPQPAVIASRIEAARPEAIHIATEGPIGWSARRYCRARGLPFTTSYTTRFPEYIAARFPVPQALSYSLLRRFHAAAAATMVSTQSLMAELSSRGFRQLAPWTRGVDTDLFNPSRVIPLDLPRPIFAYAGRVAVEKNIEAFLSLPLPGSKIVIGDGPELESLRARFPDVHFLGLLQGPKLAGHLAAADVFVFPSKTDTFGIVQLEALASGVPVAAFPVTGPKDIITDDRIGRLDNDLQSACLGALKASREACRNFALTRSWNASLSQFLGNLSPVHSARVDRRGGVGTICPTRTVEAEVL